MERELPGGTVTMLFSDVEGSTQAMHRLDAQWGAALSDQRRLLRDAFESQHGYEMGTEGDSFFVVFTTARAAIEAAVAGQRALQSHRWPLDVALPVRMGLHTGEPERHEDGYIGIDVHRAARIAAAASGGQIVLSEATRVLAGRLEGVEIRDLGRHRLKDLTQPEHLHDLVIDGLVVDFPPLRSLGSRAGLPASATPLIGRDGELAELLHSLGTPTVRLVTLTGPGGAGKTRLAIEVAAAVAGQFPAGIFFVDLHTAADPGTAWLAIADALDAAGESEEAPRDRVRRFLGTGAVLLILDNLEQLADADQMVADLFAAAPGTRVLATSRRPLHLVDEFEHQVPPLELPEPATVDPATARRWGAVDLFVRRARMVRPAFALTAENVADVVELCRRLDGLPLALELAAARSRMLSPRALLGRLGQTLGSDSRAVDRTERQRTIRATIAWSYDLLAEREQDAFRQLAVFAGRFELEAVDAVLQGVEGDAMEALLHLGDMSLLSTVDDGHGELQLSMLQTIREFARQQLEATGRADEVRLRHALWCADQAAGIDTMLAGPVQIQALDRMSTLVEDVRAALDWCLRSNGGGDQERIACGLRLVANLSMYWYRFGYAAEGRAWFDRAIVAAGSVASTDMVNALHGLGILRLQQGEVEPASAALQRAMDLAGQLGERDLQSRELNSLAIAHRISGDLDTAVRLLDQSIALARATGNLRRESAGLSNRVVFLLDAGDWQGALAASHAALASSRQIGDAWAVSSDEANLAVALLRVEGPAAAYRHLVTITPRATEQGDPELTSVVVEIFSAVMAELGNASLAAQLLGVADARRESLGMPRTGPDETLMASSFAVRDVRADPGWDRWYAEGRDLTAEEALANALTASGPETTASP